MIRRRWFFLIVFIFLYIVPTNLSSYSFPSTIPTERNMLSDFEVGETVLLERGHKTFLGGDSWSYSTTLGEYNTFDGLEYVRYLYDDLTHNATFAGHSLVLYDWYATFSNSTQILIDDMRWIVQYDKSGKWTELDLWDHSFLPAIQGSNLQFGQRFTDGGSILDVWYIIRNNDNIKILLNFTAEIQRLYRFQWQLTGVDGDLIEGDKSMTFDDVNIGWSDTELNATYEWIVANKKVDISFDSLTIGAGETYTLDPSVNPLVGGDSYDDWWWLDTTGPTWTHYITQSVCRVREYLATYWYVSNFGFVLTVPQGATIDSANLSLYEYEDSGAQNFDIWRIDEDDLGPLESDVSIPDMDWSYHDVWAFDGSGSEYDSMDVTQLVQNQVNLGGWASGQYMGFHINTTGIGDGVNFQFQDYQFGSNFGYLNVTYTEAGGNNAPSNDGCTLTNPDDTDNLYAVYKEYIFTSNVSDADGFADIDYIEMSCYSAGAYWTVRYDEDTNTFSEELGTSYIVLGGSSSANEAGNDIDITWYIEITWAHASLDNYDLRLYTVDDEPESDTDDYDLNYDYITEVDITTGPTLNDGSGTADRGDYDSIDSITATGTIDYYSSSISPASDEVDVWVSCADVAGGPWSDLTLTDGAFSLTIDSDDAVGLDTYSFIVVEEGAGSGGSDLLHSSETDTYIADRMVITILADDDTVINGTQVNFTVSVIYDYDDVSFSWWNISVTNDGVFFGVFNYSSTNFNDTDADTTNVYSVDAFNNETTHVITKFSVVTESVTWSAEGVPTTTTTDTGFFYQIFLSLEMWSIFGPALIVICGFFVAKKDRGLGIIFFIVECLVVYQYFTLVDATPFYWWHIIILMFGGIIPCGFSLLDR